MPRQRSNGYADALGVLLRSGKDSRNFSKNKYITWNDGYRFANVVLCQTCDRNLRCLSGHQSLDTVDITDRPCFAPRNILLFSYYRTVILGVDFANRRLSDYGAYGHSVSTTQNIRKCLHAIADHFPEIIGHYAEIDACMAFFKKSKGDNITWITLSDLKR